MTKREDRQAERRAEQELKLERALATMPPAVERPAEVAEPAPPMMPAVAAPAPEGEAVKPWHDGLTRRQRRFVEEYLATLNGSEAARRAGYAEASANVEAARLLAKASIASAIERAMSELSISRMRVVAEVANLAFSSLSDVVEWTADGRIQIRNSSELPEAVRKAVTKIKRDAETGVITEIEVGLKGAALAQLMKLLGLSKPGSLSIDSKGGPILVNISAADAAVL